MPDLDWQLHQFLDVPDPEGQNFASDVDKVIAAFDDVFQDPTRSSNAFDYAAAATAVGTRETRAEVMDAGRLPVSEPVGEENSTAAEIQIDGLIEAVTERGCLNGCQSSRAGSHRPAFLVGRWEPALPALRFFVADVAGLRKART